MTLLLSVIVPAYNESKTITRVVENLVTNLSSIDHEIILIDDHSRDDTALICNQLAQQNNNIKLFAHEKNQGKTEALKTGFIHCSGEIVLVQDADLEYDPQDILKLIEPILKNQADIVYGSRFLDPDKKNVFMRKSKLANLFLTFTSNLFTRYKFTDVETCYKALSSAVIKNMIITSKRFGFEIEVTAKISKLKLRVCEIPISYSCRSYSEGKKIGFMDALQAFFYIVKYNLFTSLKDSYTAIPDLSGK